MGAAIMSGIAIVVAAGISAFFAWLSHRGNAKVEQVASVLEAYNEIVKNLQAELLRVQTELDRVREDMRDCERRSEELKDELQRMRTEMELLMRAEIELLKMPNTPAAKPRKRTNKAS